MEKKFKTPFYSERLIISDDWMSVYDVGEYEAETGIKTDSKHHWMRVNEHQALISPLVEALTFYMNHVHTVHFGTQTGQTSYVHEKGKAAREALENYKKQTGEGK